MNHSSEKSLGFDDASSSPSEHKREWSLLERVISARDNTHDQKQRLSRIENILAEKPEATLGLFKEKWREYVRKELQLGRTFQSILDLDKPGPEPDGPSDEMYGWLYKAVMKNVGSSVGQVERIIAGVVQEFRPRRSDKPKV